MFFSGSNISLHCETNCVQLRVPSCTVGFLHNGVDFDYDPDYDDVEYVLSPEKNIGRRSLTIPNANTTNTGIYQCFTFTDQTGFLPLADRIIGRPIHVQVAGIYIQI